MDAISHQRASTTGEDVSSAKAGKGLQGRSPCRGMWGVPHNNLPPSPGQQKGTRSKTTQGEGMRSNTSWI